MVACWGQHAGDEGSPCCCLHWARLWLGWPWLPSSMGSAGWGPSHYCCWMVLERKEKKREKKGKWPGTLSDVALEHVRGCHAWGRCWCIKKSNWSDGLDKGQCDMMGQGDKWDWPFFQLWGASFVGTQHRNASEHLDSGEVLDEDMDLGHAAGIDCEQEGYTYRKALCTVRKLRSSITSPFIPVAQMQWDTQSNW